jgi:1-acyl-sn-glycerol-3-phosphate acyltransferase
MTLLRSLLFALVFYPGSLIAVLAALPVSSRAVRDHAARWARFHRWCCRYLLGIETRIIGTPPEGAVLVASKHQSMYETIDLVLAIHEPAIVLKYELARIPLWGQIARKYGAIPIDREGSATALRLMLKSARDAIREGRTILIFPEGTRVAPGEQPELKAGFAGIYKHLQLPVVPIAVDSGKLCPRNSFLKRSGVITFRFGETIPAGLPRAEIEARVHAAINVLDNG